MTENKGAFINIGPDLKLRFTQFDAVPHPNIRPMVRFPLPQPYDTPKLTFYLAGLRQLEHDVLAHVSDKLQSRINACTKKTRLAPLTQGKLGSIISMAF